MSICIYRTKVLRPIGNILQPVAGSRPVGCETLVLRTITHSSCFNYLCDHNQISSSGEVSLLVLEHPVLLGSVIKVESFKAFSLFGVVGVRRPNSHLDIKADKKRTLFVGLNVQVSIQPFVPTLLFLGLNVQNPCRP